jgi:hypothetical protein
MTPLLRGAVVLGLFSSACLTPVRDTTVGALDGGGGLADAGDAGLDAGSPDAGSPADAGAAPGDAGTLSPLTCAVGRWCWQHPTPQPAQALESVFVVSADEVWAGGARGALLHLKNGQWTPMTPVVDDATLSTLWGAGPNDLWAVARKSDGESRVIRFDGATWSLVPHGDLPNVTDLTGGPGGELWLLASANTTLIPSQLKRWNGAAFELVPALPSGLRPSSICVRSASEAWVVTSDANNSHPLQLHRFDGTSWSLVHAFTPASSARFNSRVGCPADGVAVVSTFNFDQGSYGYLEVRNAQVTFGTLPDGAALMRSPHGDVFSVDVRAVSQWTPSGFVYRFTLGNTESPYGVDYDFVGSTGWLANGTPVLSSWNGQAFTPAWQGFGAFDVFVSPPSLNPTDPVAVFGDGAFATRTATGWSAGTLPAVSGGDLLSVVDAYVLPNGDAWLAGNALARFTAGSQNVTIVSQLAPFQRLNDLDGSDENNVWAVGSDALLLRFSGSQWAEPVIGLPRVADGVQLNDLNLSVVDVRAANDVMILGDDVAGGRFLSIFFKWDGVSWELASSAGTTLSLFDRDTQGTLYTVEGDTVKKRAWADPTWTTLGVLPGTPLRLRVYGPDEVEVVVRTSAGASLYRWDSDRGAFDPEVLPLAFDGVRDIVPGASGSGGRSTYWASGNGGAVLRFESP